MPPQGKSIAEGPLSDQHARSRPSLRGEVWAALPILILLLCGVAHAQESEAAAEPEAPPEPPIEDKQAALERAISLRVGGNESGAEMQKKIDEIADQTDAVSAQYRTALKQIEAIRKFNGQMQTLIDGQTAELDSVADQLDRVEEVGRNVMPLMLRMIDALEAFIELDVPFLHDERIDRIGSLRGLMARADISSATKFRQIMEAYQIENEYGRTIEAYRGEIEVEGRAVTVDLLRFGRISLVFQSLDGTSSGVWDRDSRSWRTLDASFDDAIRSGLRIARKLEPPDLIHLPLAPAQPVASAPAEVVRADPPGAPEVATP